MKKRKIRAPLSAQSSNGANKKILPGTGKNSYNTRGFTLVELLVVIAIIALLMSILMPALTRVRKQAKSVLCQSNLKQWCLIFSMYTGDYDGYFHEGWYYGASPVKHWMNVLESYYQNEKDLCFCPAAVEPRTEGGRGVYSAWGIFPNGWSGLGEEEAGSYGINSWVCNTPAGQEVYGPAANYWRNIGVKNASYAPLFLDAWWFDGWPEPTNEPLQFEDDYLSSGSMEAMGDFCVNRHGGYINGLFLDCSVRRVGLKQLWKLKWHRTFDVDAPEPLWPPWMESFTDY